MSDMKKGISGFIVEGGWSDVVEHGERITVALRDVGYSGKALEEWDDWRPKAHERLGKDVREKTAKYAHLKDGPGERANQTPVDDVQEAGNELTDAYERLDNMDKALARWRASVRYLGRAADSTGRKAVRTVEDVVYKRVMTRTSPFYFDNELVSANIRQSNQANGLVYAFEVNVNDDDLKAVVSDRLETFENEVDRWHLDIKKDTRTVEAAEGIDISKN